MCHLCGRRVEAYRVFLARAQHSTPCEVHAVPPVALQARNHFRGSSDERVIGLWSAVVHGGAREAPQPLARSPPGRSAGTGTHRSRRPRPRACGKPLLHDTRPWFGNILSSCNANSGPMLLMGSRVFHPWIGAGRASRCPWPPPVFALTAVEAVGDLGRLVGEGPLCYLKSHEQTWHGPTARQGHGSHDMRSSSTCRDLTRLGKAIRGTEASSLTRSCCESASMACPTPWRRRNERAHSYPWTAEPPCEVDAIWVVTRPGACHGVREHRNSGRCRRHRRGTRHAGGASTHQ